MKFEHNLVSKRDHEITFEFKKMWLYFKQTLEHDLNISWRLTLKDHKIIEWVST